MQSTTKTASAKPASAAIAAATAELRALSGPLFPALEQIGVAVCATDPTLADNPLIFVNQAFTETTLYAPEDVLGRNCRLLQGANTDRQTVASIAAAVAAGQGADTEILNYRKDGSPFWNRLFIMPVRDAAGTPRFFLATQLDVNASHAVRGIEAKLADRQSSLDIVNERLLSVLAISGAAATWEWYIAEHRIVGDAGFAALYGITPEQAAAGVAAPTFFSIIHPEDVARIRLSVGGMLRGAEVFAKSFRITGANGLLRWVHARGTSHLDAGDRPTRFSGVLVDITEQKRLEERLRIAQSAGGVGTFEYVEGYGTVSVAPQFCNLLGLHPATDLPVRTLNAVVFPGDPKIIETTSNPAQGQAQNVEFRIVRRDTGELRWLARRGEHLQDTETTGTRFMGVIYDITEAKRTEARLRTLNETLEASIAERTAERDQIWRVSQDLLGVADADGIWQSVNPAWHALLGWSAADIIGRGSAWLEHPEDRAAYRMEAARLAADGGTFAFESRMRQRDGGYRWLSWTAVPEQGRLYCVGRDVTAARHSAEALLQVEEKLRQSQKMEAVGQLTGGLAHDFNNLLTGITGSLELMQSRMAQGRLGDVDRYITAAQGAARRAAALTHRLLAFSRQQTLDPKPTDVNALVAGMEELIRRTIGPAITLQVTAAPGLWLTLVDPNQLENALLNLCINARDAMPNRGHLVVETANRPFGAANAAPKEAPPGDYVCLCVTDNGTGMTPDVMARVFDPFFTTKPIGQGTGLGLSMIYGFARQSGGEVRINSTVGEGTTVCILLPRTEAATPAEPHHAAEHALHRAGQGETVLVVDDDATVRMLVRDVLHDLGYTALEAQDGAAGLAILRSPARVDLLVTDVGLPGGMNGRQVADAGRVLRPGLKTLFITGYAEHTALSPAHLAPGMQVMTKPFEMDVLAGRIRDLIAAT